MTIKRHLEAMGRLLRAMEEAFESEEKGLKGDGKAMSNGLSLNGDFEALKCDRMR